MADLFESDIEDFEAPGPKGLERHQLKAAAAPHLRSKDLANEAPQSSGNFKDLEDLLEQLGSPAVFELGKPLPQEKFMPTARVGGCHASHNRALLDEGAD